MALLLPSQKFHATPLQWRVVAEGQMLLRVTWAAGRGIIMTPTADDDRGFGRKAYPDRNRLIRAMQLAVDTLLPPETRIWLSADEADRQFLEMRDIPTLPEATAIAKALAKAMAASLRADAGLPWITGRLTCRDGQLVAA